MFYEQLLRSQIPKIAKKLLNLTVFFALLGSTSTKAARRTLVKLTPEYWMEVESESRNRSITHVSRVCVVGEGDMAFPFECNLLCNFVYLSLVILSKISKFYLCFSKS